MKSSLLKASGIAVLVAGFFAGQAFAAVGVITNSKHDLSSTSTGGNQFDGTAELCVFCHTPHAADNTASVPLWNRVLPVPASFSLYSTLGTTSLDGYNANVGSVSIACLSCHDGSTTLNTVINMPGSGGVNPAGAAMAGSWTVTTLTGGKIAAAATLIGTDLTNDHPVGIQYGGGPKPASLPALGTDYDNTMMKDADFKTVKSAVGGTWWVDTTGGVAGTREKTDLLLYTRTEAGGYGTPEPYVECATCHDPHNGVGGNGTFLRASNAASALCLSCHIK